MAQRHRGSVKWFDEKKGYGFLVCPELSSDDVFIHYSSIRGQGFKTVEKEELVEFEVVKRGEKGLQAIKVDRLGKDPSQLETCPTCGHTKVAGAA